MLVILAAWEVGMKRISVQGQPLQKVTETPISTNKLGVVVFACNSSYWEA
jgi:hypothetical protein